MNPSRVHSGPWEKAALVIAMLTLAIRPAAAGPEAQSPSELKRLSLEELFDLEVTTVSQKPESLSKAAAAIHVVTSDDLRLTGTPSIPEALRNIPGVEVARVDSRQYAITARGFNGTVANKLLVLMDGRSVYTPLFSGVFWDVQDTFIEDIDRIEVIRGPGATVWGANAVNGVINVITKDAAHTQGTLLAGGGGNAERGFGGARYGGAFGAHTFFRVYGKYFERDASLRPGGQEAGDDFRMTQGGFRVDWTPPGRDGFTLQGDVYDGSELQPTADAVELGGGNALARWTRRFSTRSDLQLRAYYDRTDRDSPPVFREALDTYDVELRHRFPGGERHDMVWGLGYRLIQDQVTNGPALAFLPAHKTLRLFSGFVQDELAIADARLRLIFGSKFEHNDYTGFEVQPSARLAWTVAADQTVWAAVSRAVRTPSRIDRDFFAPATPPFFLAGGPGFESEVLRAFELGYKVQPTSALTASVATFYNLYDHLRSLEMGSPLLLANGLEGEAHGVELEASYQAREAWRWSAGYSFLELALDRTPSSTDISQERQEGDSPRHQGFVRSTLALSPAVTVDLGLRYVGDLPNQQVPEYTTGDARLTWRPRSEIELALIGRDLFDPRHPEFGTPSGRREVERSFAARATCRF